jgi:hypothetical protein
VGGYGSGRSSSKHKAERCRSLDVNQLNRKGCLKPGHSGDWSWTRGGEGFGAINFKTEDARLVLSYNVSQCGGDWEPVTQHVYLTSAGCHYGNTRPYFICPGTVSGRQCGRRVGKLFSADKYFLCRRCYRIAYASQSEARYDRMLRRANKLRVALGGKPGTAHWIAQKPKGMWQRTYQRQRFEIEWYENQASHLFIAKFAHLLSSEERGVYFGEA